MSKFLKRISWEKIEMNWNKNPIKMKDFLVFLTVPVYQGKGHLGYENGWTKWYNDENKLCISGGIFKGVEYLNSLQYKKNLDNPYNKFVNPFYLFEIMTDTGKKFFLDYYRDEIAKEINNAEKELALAQSHRNDIVSFYKGIGFEEKILAVESEA